MHIRTMWIDLLSQSESNGIFVMTRHHDAHFIGDVAFLFELLNAAQALRQRVVVHFGGSFVIRIYRIRVI